MPAGPNRQWTRDETVLAYDLYKRIGTAGKSAPQIAEFCRLLNAVAAGDPEAFTSRSPSAVEVKLATLAHVDTNGKAGLDAASEVDRRVVHEFRDQPEALVSAAVKVQRALAEASGLPKDGAERPIHLILKWRRYREPQTIAFHKELADSKGSVWWGQGERKEGGRSPIGRRKLTQFREQLSQGVPTYVYLYRPGETWRTKLEQLTVDDQDVDHELVPASYKNTSASLWVRISEFEKLPPNWPLQNLEPARPQTSGRPMDAFLRGRSSLLYVRELHDDSTPESDDCFILVQREVHTSDYADEEGTKYSFDFNVPGRAALVEAGGGRFVYYRPQSAAGSVAGSFFGAGRVSRVEDAGVTGEGTAAFVAHLSDYQPFARPVHRSEFLPSHWSPQNPISKIACTEYAEILSRGTDDDTGLDYGFDWLQRETMWGSKELELLRDSIGRTQVVLAGPPGTGKTWVAKAMVKHLTGNERKRFRLVQFHPGYGYEEFMEGLRPDWDKDSNAMMFRPVAGVVLQLTEAAIASNETHYLIIDEMNRANLPRVLGELMYLFEYRDPDDAIQLQYSSVDPSHPERPSLFYLPETVRFIGTMNTADRSIRSIDTALRRRFEVFVCSPRPEFLETWFTQPGHENTVAGLADGLRSLNAQLQKDYDDHHQVGHTYLMKPEMNSGVLRGIWKRQILPLLEEYFFDRTDILASYRLETFWPQA